MSRPTLADQITISKLSDEECIKLLTPHGLDAIRFWFWIHFGGERRFVNKIKKEKWNDYST